MRNLKKILALVLALMMVLSMMVTANAAFADQDSINADYAEAVEVMNAIGIGVTGQNAGSGHDFNSFLVVDLFSVGEVSGTGSDHDGQNHHQGQNQSENLLQISHGGFPPFLICTFGAFLFVQTLDGLEFLGQPSNGHTVSTAADRKSYEFSTATLAF